LPKAEMGKKPPPENQLEKNSTKMRKVRRGKPGGPIALRAATAVHHAKVLAYHYLMGTLPALSAPPPAPPVA